MGLLQINICEHVVGILHYQILMGGWIRQYSRRPAGRISARQLGQFP